MRSSRMLREETGNCPGILGHVDIHVTQNVYGKADKALTGEVGHARNMSRELIMTTTLEVLGHQQIREVISRLASPVS